MKSRSTANLVCTYNVSRQFHAEILNRLLTRVVLPQQLDRVKFSELHSFEFEQFLLGPKSAYYGYEFTAFVSDWAPEKRENLQKRCFSCLVEACRQVNCILNIYFRINFPIYN